MKDQYFGDINDFRKYGLLRSILEATGFRMLVAWMLTENDGGKDGRFTSYLKQPVKWRHFDPELFDGLRGVLHSDNPRAVELIENTRLLAESSYFSKQVPDVIVQRCAWFKELCEDSHDRDFIFLDPDNGLEVKSRPYGTRNSCKYLYWNEVQSLWSLEKSLLIYQHFIREAREKFTRRLVFDLSERCNNSLVYAFPTSHVVFLMALQPKHHFLLPGIIETVKSRWKGQILI